MLPARRTAPAAVAVLFAATLTLPGCARSPEVPLPGRPQSVEVRMKEYRFSFRPPLSTGRTVFEVRNTGKLRHDLVLAVLPEDVPPLHEQLRGSDRRTVAGIATLPARQPGSRATFAVDLAPGRYGIICFVLDPDGQQHAQKGMSSEFRVR